MSKHKFSSYKLRKWRVAVLKRDGYRCQLCNDKPSQTSRLSAHHIEPKALVPSLAYDINNGITLCSAVCHRRICHQEQTFNDHGWWKRLVMHFKWVVAQNSLDGKE